MITADKLKELTTFTAEDLKNALGAKASDLIVAGAKFIGITNGGQFCYTLVYRVANGTDSVKVFLTYNHAQNLVYADSDMAHGYIWDK